MTYNDICNRNGTDKGDARPSGNGYSLFYDFWFSKIKDREVKILEIGVDEGKSLKTNYDFFQKGQIYGLDIHSKSFFDNDRTKTFILDQSDKKQIQDTFNRFKTDKIEFDIIIDDGSHDVQHQQQTFGIFFQLLKNNGIYILEDLGSSYLTLGSEMYGYVQTQDKINNNTVKFLQQRPFYSPWIDDENIKFLNQNIDYVCLFDKTNYDLPYSKNFSCINNFPIRSITSIIKRL